jgi:hypothetical protein
MFHFAANVAVATDNSTALRVGASPLAGEQQPGSEV